MNVFVYKARTKKNEPIRGRVEASSAREAAAILRERGLFVISVIPFEESTILRVLTQRKPSQSDIVNFTRQLSTMVTAGLPITESLGILSAQSKPSMHKVIDEVRREVEGGATLSKALEKQQGTFTKVYISLINAGESAGVLDQVLSRLADTMEKDMEFTSKTKGALIYPGIVVSAMIVVAFIMMIFVIPQLTQMYTDFGAELPTPTRILISVSNFTSSYWYIVIAAVAGAIAAFRYYRKTPNGRLKTDGWLLKIPVMGVLQEKTLLTEMTRTLSLLVGAGISLLLALEIVLDTIDNRVYYDALEKISKDVEKGQPLSQSISKHNIFPIIMSQMVSVGEETGKLDEVLLKVSKYFEAEAENAIKGLTTALEPLIMIILGLGVGFLMIAIIMPIYNLTSQF